MRFFRVVTGGDVMGEERVGEVVKFFSKPSVAAVKITEGEVAIGDTVKFTGHTTDFEDTVHSMEIDNKQIEKAKVGDYIGIKVADRVRPGDEMFKIIPE
jgi:putative protease